MTGRPPRSTAAAELDVPRSMPMIAMAFPYIDSRDSGFSPPQGLYSTRII
jgi:hypothetical protein